MSDWESVKTRLEEKRRRGEEFHAESIDVQVSDIRAALERVEEVERLRAALTVGVTAVVNLCTHLYLTPVEAHWHTAPRQDLNRMRAALRGGGK